LKKGQWLELSQRDVDVVYQMARLPPKEAASVTKKEQDRRERLSNKGQPKGSRKSRR
jgi:23S rRNA pseudouridine2605 synthase